MATYAALEKDEEVGLYRQEHVVKPESSSLKSQTSIFVLRALCAAVLLLSYTMGVLYAFGKSEAPIASAYATSWWQSMPKDFSRVVRFNGTFGSPSPYRGPPSDEVDRAWNAVILDGPLDIRLTDNELESLGVDAPSLVRFPTGNQLISFEYGHNLHCLNVLRMWTHRGYYNSRALEFSDDEATLREHTDHCIEMLRQFMMCNADLNFRTVHWVKGRVSPYPDFNTLHQCRDFDAIVDFTLKHQAPVRGMPAKPEGVEELDVAP